MLIDRTTTSRTGRFATWITLIIILFSCESWTSSVRAEEQLSDSTTQNEPAEQTVEQPQTPTTTFIKNTQVNLSYYFDSREYNTMNVLINSTALPWGFNVFGFTDFHGTEGVPTERFELNRFYHEYRLRRPLDDVPFLGITGLDLELEYSDSDLPKDGVARLAVGYQHPVPFLYKESSWLQWRILPWSSNGQGWQVSLTHFLVLSERFKLIGFADYNIMNDRPNEWVAESELSFSLTNTFDLILEGRYNGFEEAIPGLDGVGVAGGIRINL